ncbi:hypothetical protein DFH27DRAFT_573607 [Peziza echinospora]|nr:hypothetical protein DFH27DRAFT_573607 [Peziza echinospora]
MANSRHRQGNRFQHLSTPPAPTRSSGATVFKSSSLYPDPKRRCVNSTSNISAEEKEILARWISDGREWGSAMQIIMDDPELADNELTATLHGTEEAVTQYVRELLQDRAYSDRMVKMLARALVVAIFKHVGYQAVPKGPAGADAHSNSKGDDSSHGSEDRDEYELAMEFEDDFADEDALYHAAMKQLGDDDDDSDPAASISRGVFLREFLVPRLSDPRTRGPLLEHLNVHPGRTPAGVTFRECRALLRSMLSHAALTSLHKAAHELSLADALTVLKFIDAVGEDEAARWFGWAAMGIKRGDAANAANAADAGGSSSTPEEPSRGVKLVRLFVHIVQHLIFPWTRQINRLPVDGASLRYRIFDYHANTPSGRVLCADAGQWGYDRLTGLRDAWVAGAATRGVIASKEEVEKKADKDEVDRKVDSKADKAEMAKLREADRAEVAELRMQITHLLRLQQAQALSTQPANKENISP